MEEKKGKLELLCGPSGVGKTSSLDEVKISYRVIDKDSRPIRVKEKDGIDGIFISAKEFEQRIQQDPDFIWYQTDDGRRYGFGQELKEALKAGEHCSEQIVEFEPIKLIANKFNDFAEINKTLFLASYEQIRRQLFIRSKKIGNYKQRLQKAEANLRIYLLNINYFNEVIYNYPKLLTKEESIQVINEYIDKLEKNIGFVLEYNLGGIWQEKICAEFGEFLDLLIFYTMLGNSIAGIPYDPVVDPEFQLNVLWDNEFLMNMNIAITNGNEEMFDLLEKKLNTMLDKKAGLLSVFNAYQNYGAVNLRKTYRSVFYKKTDLDFVSDTTQMENIYGNDNVGQILKIFKLASFVIDHENVEKMAKDFQENLFSIQTTGQKLDDIFSTKILDKVILKPLEQKETVRSEVNSTKSVLQFGSRKIGRETFACYDWQHPELASEHGISLLFFDLSRQMELISIFNYFEMTDMVYSVDSNELIFPLYLATKLEWEFFSASIHIINEANFRYYTEEYLKIEELIEHTFKECEKYLVIYKKQLQLKEIDKEYQSRKNLINNYGFVLDLQNIEKQIETIGMQILNEKKNYDMFCHGCVLGFISFMLDINDKFKLLLHLYSAFYDNQIIRDFFEVEFLKFVVDFFQPHLNYVKINSWEYIFLFYFHLQFLNNIKRIMLADRSKPNSTDNLWSYPIWPDDPQTFFKEYFITDFPEPLESYEKIRQLITEIRDIREKRGE